MISRESDLFSAFEVNCIAFNPTYNQLKVSLTLGSSGASNLTACHTSRANLGGTNAKTAVFHRSIEFLVFSGVLVKQETKRNETEATPTNYMFRASA